MTEINWNTTEQSSLFVNADDWNNLLQDDSNRPQKERKEVEPGTHTVEIKKVELKPATEQWPSQISVQVYFPEFNSTLFDNLPTDDAQGFLFRTRIFLSAIAKSVGLDWRDTANHSTLFEKATGASGSVEFSWSESKGKKYPRFKWLSVDAVPF